MSSMLRKVLWTSAAVIFLALSIWFFGHRQLGGFDMSALIDTGWRIASGQRPYIDFPLTTPVLFYIGAGLAVWLWGAKWSAFVLAAIAMAVLAFLAQLYLLARILSWKHSLAIALVCQMLTGVVTAYWWYNSVSVSIACVFLTAAYVFASQPEKRGSAYALWASLLLLVLTKPNIAGSAAFLIFVVLILFSPYRGRVFLIYFAALISFFLVLFALKLNPVDVLRSYMEMSKNRGMPSFAWFINDKPFEHLVTLPLLVLSLLPMLERMLAGLVRWKANREQLKGLWPHFMISLVVFAVGLFSMFTNSDSNLAVGLPFFVLGGSVFCLLLPFDAELAISSKLFMIIALSCVAASFFGCAIMNGFVPHAFVIDEGSYFNILIASLSILGVLFFGESFHLFSNAARLLKRFFAFENLIWILLFACAVVSVYAGAMRWRVRYIGPDLFYTDEPLVQIHDIPFFENFWISPRTQTMMAEVKTVLSEKYTRPENWKNAPIYFGPRIGFSYAAFGVASPLDFPIWWHPNNSFSDIYTDHYIQSFLDHKFEVCIFFGSGTPDVVFLPDPILNSLSTDYNRVDYSDIIVYIRR